MSAKNCAKQITSIDRVSCCLNSFNCHHIV
jgi:hypothetical protein